jgi:hypothetical protein
MMSRLRLCVRALCGLLCLGVFAAGCSGRVGAGTKRDNDDVKIGNAAAGGDAGTSSAEQGGAAAEDAPSLDPCLGPCPDDLSKRPTPLPRPQCPEDEPEVGTTCTTDGARCGYGSAAVALCRHYYDCTSGRWQQTKPGPATPCEPRNTCPNTPPARGDHCEATDGIPCEYPGLQCFCESRFNFSGGAGNWVCYGPPRDVRCPAALPNLGEGCDTRGLECAYGISDCRSPTFSAVFCFEGQWEQAADGSCSG